MESLSKKIEDRLIDRILQSSARGGKNLDRSAEEVHDRLDELTDEMANFLVEKFDDFWGYEND